VTAYVAWPLLRQWVAAMRLQVELMWAAYRRRAAWRF